MKLKKLVKLFFGMIFLIILSFAVIIAFNYFSDKDIPTVEQAINYTQKYQACLSDNTKVTATKDASITQLTQENKQLKSRTCLNETKMIYNNVTIVQNTTCPSQPNNNYTLALIRQVGLLEQVNEDCYYGENTTRYQRLYKNHTNCLNKLANIKEDLE